MLRWVLPLLAFALAGPGFAAEGVLEINQVCAVETGCFAGDSAGFPVTIDGATGHSYRLTSDLTVPNENTNGIVVHTDDIGIDLNDFAILGPVRCSGSPLTCTPDTGTGSGVESASQIYRGISVKNGSVAGMGNAGVLLGDQAEVTSLRVRWNRAFGIYAQGGSSVSGNTAHQNGGYGILAGSGSTVSANAAYQNGSFGIFASGTGLIVSGNATYQNGGDGINAFAGAAIFDNTSYQNKSNGITALSGSSVQRNTVRANTGFGLNLQSATYRENTISSNSAGSVTGSLLIDMGDNSCNFTTTCP